MRRFLYIYICAVISFCLALPAVSFAATITGVATYQGEQPKLKVIKMDADPICSSKHKDPVVPQTIVLGPKMEMKNVFVYISQGAPKGAPAHTEPVVLSQSGCMYNPPVAGVQVGQPLKFLNPDGTLHNVHALSKVNPEFNLAMPKFRTEAEKIFDKPEFMFEVKCDVHPWMTAHVAVMDNPFFSLTGADGRYEIKDLPPGDYTLDAWQQRLPIQHVPVKIKSADEKVEVNFTFSRPDKK